MGYRNFNREFEIDEEKAAEFLENAVEKILTEEDIDTLVELGKLFKKNVPLTHSMSASRMVESSVLMMIHQDPHISASPAASGRCSKRNTVVRSGTRFTGRTVR